MRLMNSLVTPCKSSSNTLVWEYGWVYSGGERFASLGFNDFLSIASDVTRLNLTITRQKDAVVIINPILVAQVETANGYLWIVDRWLDLLYQAFGPIGRFGMPEWPRV
ncbi:uncharacterized protein BO97DRAFT_428005 [Aspergillus homomorphus CBS 101889]|uniref:Uncharacterized protein n=1 Tax=Aspergillus homomorphus (strain CBS 101889) TaxID=1450537 RepID=A0A395HNQ7_ASPHC|nr:hypothetical protein BO97DRAFT_428005 [Aspergillus homomorphus CBS 101889]RAL08905.1 hypothetical protein BO97DRAFT_428005 [Aspergillus homomorphus CBS 101889]